MGLSADRLSDDLQDLSEGSSAERALHFCNLPSGFLAFRPKKQQLLFLFLSLCSALIGHRAMCLSQALCKLTKNSAAWTELHCARLAREDADLAGRIVGETGMDTMPKTQPRNCVVARWSLADL